MKKRAPKKKAASGFIIEKLRPFFGKKIAGATVLVTRAGKELEFEAGGWADLKTKRPMRKDTMFWVASMTKPITSLAVLTLWDEKKLSIDDPIEKYLPEYKGQWLVSEKSEDRLVLVKNTKAPTLRQMLAHTDGLPVPPRPAAQTSLAEWVTGISRLPLDFVPGTKWAYNNSGMNALGRIVEVVSKQPFAEFVQERFFKPLGMRETAFVLTPAQLKRVASAYKYDAETTKLSRMPIHHFHEPVTDPRLTICPGGGLFSTTRDMQIFYQMLLDGCVAKGKRYLSKKTFAEFTGIQTGDLECGFTAGMSFGLGPGIVREPQGVTATHTRGTFGHGGVYGTQAWCDPKRRALYIYMVQSGGLPTDYSEEKGPENPWFVFNRAANELLTADEKR